MQLGCVVMAAGNAARFGKNKLLAEYRGKTLIRRTLETAACTGFSAVAVVTQYGEIEALARAFGFAAVRNEAPERGISRTIRLGTQALAPHCGGIAYLVADQPLLSAETVARLVRAFLDAPERIVVPAAGERRGNPCIFPAALFPELLVLEGDRGGTQVIRRHPERVLRVEVPERELLDVDTAEALEEIKKSLA